MHMQDNTTPAVAKEAVETDEEPVAYGMLNRPKPKNVRVSLSPQVLALHTSGQTPTKTQGNRRRSNREARQCIGADSSLVSLTATALDGTPIQLSPTFDPKNLMYHNQVLLPSETEKVKITAQARDTGSQVFIHCLDPRRDKDTISFMKMLATQNQQRFVPRNHNERALVKLQALSRGSLSRHKFKQLLKEKPPPVVNRNWSKALDKVGAAALGVRASRAFTSSIHP